MTVHVMMANSVSMTVSAARETGRDPGNCQNCGRKNQLLHFCTRQSVSIAPTSACATVLPFTLASPWNHHMVLRRPMLVM